MANPRMLKSGDQVRYISDVHSDYTGKVVKVVDFNLENRFCGVEGLDGMYFVAFWNEIEAV